jgi:hypothetical protein
MKKQVSDLLSKDKHTEHSDWREAWSNILRHYTSTRLTFDRDRWIAFSGLANMIQRASGLTLIAGLWREPFLLELACTSNHCGQRINSHLPTWSWISLDNAIRSTSCSYNIYRYAMPQAAEVVNMPSELLNPIFRGSTCLARCTITLRAPFREFESAHSRLEPSYAHDLGPATKGKNQAAMGSQCDAGSRSEREHVFCSCSAKSMVTMLPTSSAFSLFHLTLIRGHGSG